MCLFIYTDLWVRKHFYNVSCLLDFFGMVAASRRNTGEPEPEEAFLFLSLVASFRKSSASLGTEFCSVDLCDLFRTLLTRETLAFNC